jgi:hypothetical protein
MGFCTVVPAQLSEWGWLFGFGVGSLALVALVVLADAIYEGYWERIRRAHHPPAKAEADGRDQRLPGQAHEAGVPRKKAA